MRKMMRLFTVTTLMLCMFTSTCFAGTLDKNTSTGSTAVKIDVTKTDPDKNGDGKITEDDFTDINGDGEIDADDGFVDTNGDGEMNVKDFLSEDSVDKDDVGDVNGDGVIDENDESIFDGNDNNGDGRVDDSDLEDKDANGDNKITEDDFEDTNGDGEIDTEDGFVDTDGDGEMTPKDFKEGTGESDSVSGDLNGDDIVDKKDEEIFDNIDINGDGKITDEDFEGGSLPSESFDYTVTVPTAMTLSVENGATSLTAETSFGQTGKVTIKGSAGANKHVSIAVASGTAGDTGCNFTLVKSDNASVKTNGGSFYIGSLGANTYAASSSADKTAMLSNAGLVKDLVITGVKGVTEYGVYNGSLVYTITVVSE